MDQTEALSAAPQPARMGASTMRILAFVAGLVLAGGCSFGEILADYGDPVTLQRSDLVGTWHSGDRRVLLFSDDGTFAATDLPYEAFDDLVPTGFDPARSRLDGSGEWTLEPPAKEGLSSAVKLSFGQLVDEAVATSGPNPSARQDDGIIRLVFYYVGSGGNSWTAYEKCASACS